MSRHVVFLLTPEIHLVTSSTMTGTSAGASVSLLPDNCWLELDNWLECLITPDDDECFPSSFLDSDLLLELESFGTFGSVLCLDRWWYALLLSTSMITFISITEMLPLLRWSHDYNDADFMRLLSLHCNSFSVLPLEIIIKRVWDHDLSWTPAVTEPSESWTGAGDQRASECDPRAMPGSGQVRGGVWGTADIHCTYITCEKFRVGTDHI